MDTRIGTHRVSNSSSKVIILGIVSVLIALSIGFAAYIYTVKITELRSYKLYMSKAKMLANVANASGDVAGDVVLNAIVAIWKNSGGKPSDELICIVDRNAYVLLHTERPNMVGTNIGNDLVFNSKLQQGGFLQEIVNSQADCVGGYLPFTGQEQIAAFASVPRRQWTLGVIRSKKALTEEIKSNIFYLAVGYIIICVFILPITVTFLYEIFRTSNKKRIYTEVDLSRQQTYLEGQVEKRTAEIQVVNDRRKSDIDMRMKTEEELRQNKRFLQDFFDGIPDGICVIDRKMKILRVNKVMEEWYPHVLSLHGKLCYEAFHGRSEPCTVCPSVRTLEEGTLQMDVVPLVGPGVTTGQLELYTFPLKDYNGNTIGVIEYLRNITDRKQAEEALRESERRFKSLVSNIPGVVYRCANDPHCTMEFISNSIEEISGYPSSDFVNNSVRSYSSIIYKKDRSMVRSAVNEGVNKKGTYIVEYRIIHASSEVRWVYEKGQGLFDDEGNVFCLDGVIFDITDRKKAGKQNNPSLDKKKDTSSGKKIIPSLL